MDYDYSYVLPESDNIKTTGEIAADTLTTDADCKKALPEGYGYLLRTIEGNE